MATWISSNRAVSRAVSRVHDAPIGRKLFYGFASLTALLGLVVAGLFLTVSRLGDAHDQIVQVAEARSRAADSLRYAAADLRAAQQAYILAEPSSHSEFDRAAQRFEARLDSVRLLFDSPVDQALVHRIQTGYATFLQIDQMISEAIQASHWELARNLVLGPESLAFEFIADDAATLADRAEPERDAASGAFAATSADAKRRGALLVVLALAVMIATSWTLTRLICHPLRRVQRAAERAAGGDLTAEVEVTGSDETACLARAFNVMMVKLREREAALLLDHTRQETSARIHRALEMSDNEEAALAIVGRTLAELVPDMPVELLLADNSQADLEQAAVASPSGTGPGCPVASPFACVAVRGGSAVTFSSSEAIDACPHLHGRSTGPCSAACIPVGFMGRAIGVIHVVAPEGQPPSLEQIEGLSVLSAQAGARIGILRTMLRTAVQASTDSLTGLMNRRSFLNRVRSLRRSDTPFALVMADVDHFKRLNDTHGHSAGDRALTTYASVIRHCLRQGDVVSRWGGEEFAFAFVGPDPSEAVDMTTRIRTELAAQLATSDIPWFTVSYGVVAEAACSTLEEAIRLADNALYEAKAAGRDRTVVTSPELATSGTVIRMHAPERSTEPTVGLLATIAGAAHSHLTEETDDDTYSPHSATPIWVVESTS